MHRDKMKDFLKITFTLLVYLSIKPVFAQLPPVDVAEMTIKVGAMSSQELYYGFAEGDSIVFNFEELKGKDLKEIDITELPGNSKFRDYRAVKVDDKRIYVNKKSVYQFKFINSAIALRICKIKIQRIPKTLALVNFNTNWKWKNSWDTAYLPFTMDTIVGYDTIHHSVEEKVLAKTEQVEEILFDKNQRVENKGISKSRKNYTLLAAVLPEDIKEPYKEEKNIAWAYWIGVGSEAQEAYVRNTKIFSSIASKVASTFISPLAGLAIGIITDLVLPTKGDNVEYFLIPDRENADSFLRGSNFSQFDKGNGIAAYGRNLDRLHGTFYIGLHNDNAIRDIDVNVKIVVIREIKTYEDREVDHPELKPKFINVNKKRMVVTARQVRVNAE